MRDYARSSHASKPRRFLPSSTHAPRCWPAPELRPEPHELASAFRAQPRMFAGPNEAKKGKRPLFHPAIIINVINELAEGEGTRLGEGEGRETSVRRVDGRGRASNPPLDPSLAGTRRRGPIRAPPQKSIPLRQNERQNISSHETKPLDFCLRSGNFCLVFKAHDRKLGGKLETVQSLGPSGLARRLGMVSRETSEVNTPLPDREPARRTSHSQGRPPKGEEANSEPPPPPTAPATEGGTRSPLSRTEEAVREPTQHELEGGLSAPQPPPKRTGRPVTTGEPWKAEGISKAQWYRRKAKAS